MSPWRAPAASARRDGARCRSTKCPSVPVCCPLRLHAVSPCLIANTFVFASAGSDVVGLCRAHTYGGRFLPPPPAGDLGHVVAIPRDVLLVLDQSVADRLLGVSGPCREVWHTVDDIAH